MAFWASCTDYNYQFKINMKTWTELKQAITHDLKNNRTCWLRKETNPKPLERPVFWSHITLASLNNDRPTSLINRYSFVTCIDISRRAYEQVLKAEKLSNKAASVTSGLRSPTNMLKWPAFNGHKTHSVSQASLKEKAISRTYLMCLPFDQ